MGFFLKILLFADSQLIFTKMKMKNIFFITLTFFFGLILNNIKVQAQEGISRKAVTDTDNRRMNIEMVTNNISNAQFNDNLLTQFVSYDLQQVKLNAGRLFIRDKIISP